MAGTARSRDRVGPADVVRRMVRDRWDRGENVEEIAWALGLSQEAVRLVVQGRRWEDDDEFSLI